MTFKQAAKKLAKIADGRYHGLNFELTIPKTNIAETNCRLFITESPNCWMVDAPTWAEAFTKLDAEMNPGPPVCEQIPDVSDAVAAQP